MSSQRTRTRQERARRVSPAKDPNYKPDPDPIEEDVEEEEHEELIGKLVTTEHGVAVASGSYGVAVWDTAEMVGFTLSPVITEDADGNPVALDTLHELVVSLTYGGRVGAMLDMSIEDAARTVAELQKWVLAR